MILSMTGKTADAPPTSQCTRRSPGGKADGDSRDIGPGYKTGQADASHEREAAVTADQPGQRLQAAAAGEIRLSKEQAATAGTVPLANEERHQRGEELVGELKMRDMPAVGYDHAPGAGNITNG